MLRILFITALLLLAASASAVPEPSLYERNLAFLDAAAPTSDRDVRTTTAAMAADRGIDLGVRPTQLAGMEGRHVGEIWYECFHPWLIDGPCAPAVSNLSTNVPCLGVPAHWALFVWAPRNDWVTIPGDGFFLTWTEAHTGLGPLVHDGAPGDLIGSGCIQFNDPDLVLVVLEGVFVPA